MKEIILIVGHGSRGPGGNEEIAEFVEDFKSNYTELPVELCYIEFAEVLLAEGLKNAAAKAEKVIVVPLILNAAGHVKMEIPQAIEEVRKDFPKISFILAKHIGAVDKVLDVLKRQLTQVAHALSQPDPKTTGVILLGRGSSDRIANGEVSKMARWLYEECDHDLVDIAFTGITFPRLESAVKAQVALGMTQIIVLPYYLFNGRLMERIDAQVDRLNMTYPQIAFGLGEYFGFEKEIYELVKERIAQTSEKNPKMMECDGCNYRKEAESEHHHDHHHH
ncbi:MAG: sirohydrochlorin chelatase [SAR324 cluster bacterium]|nr:sirohydrochlorin chelatase [SAR324 cluster bacterium]